VQERHDDKNIRRLWNVTRWLEKKGKDGWLEKVTNGEVLKASKEYMKRCKYWTLFGKGNIDGLVVFWTGHILRQAIMSQNMTSPKYYYWRQKNIIIEGKTRGKQNWRMRIQTLLDLVEDSAVMHSNELQRTQKDGDTEETQRKGVRN